MGYIRHHAIIVTSYDYDMITRAFKKAIKIGLSVSELIRSEINSYISFFIVPDGSLEGWPESDIGDVRRKKFVKWINKQAYEDDSNSLSFTEVYYGDQNGKSKVVKNN